ncbi:hypothetical protein [Yinghuangia sp. YIM S10712]|uniref:hypothetical protein n=1 Tax=Yinghuangia sp. YIM S10712 TaxID=3436930 RepID=UPI003F534E87
MKHTTNEQFFGFSDRLEYMSERLGGEPWITVYEYKKKENESTSYYSALASPEVVPRCLANTSWDLLITSGLPGYAYLNDGTHEYYRFGIDNGVEPFIVVRDFHNLKPSYLDLSEEFRHFHNLYEDRRKNVFTALDDNGDDVEVVRMSPTKVEVRAKYLRDYLATRNIVMLVFFEYDRWSAKTLDELGLSEQNEDTQDATHRYIRFVKMLPGMSDDRRTIARLMGKKVVHGTENYRPSSVWDREHQQFEEFIIGVDDNGKKVMFTCDEEALSNYFGKNPGSPNFLTPVFFRKEVMAKYYGDPSKYRVEDGHVYCGGYWSLRLDNNHRDYVVVYLGDLGHLSHTEQLYWKSFNTVPDGTPSEVAFRRGILGQWTDADEPALAFKASYRRFRDRWSEKFGWDLFKDLNPDDAHYWSGLHVPAGENQKEFDDQVMALAKLLIERLNEREIAKHATIEANDKGITKFDKYLTVVGFPERQELILLLRNLNSLRTGPAHVKGKEYERGAKHFDLESKGMPQTFSDLLVDATRLIKKLDDFMLSSDDL